MFLLIAAVSLLWYFPLFDTYVLTTWQHISQTDHLFSVNKALTGLFYIVDVHLRDEAQAKLELNQKETKQWRSRANGIGQYHMGYKW